MPNKPEVTKLTMTHTKEQMLKAYSQLVKQLEEQREGEMKPEQKREEILTKEAVETTDGLSTDGVSRSIGGIKTEVGTFFNQLTDSLEEELNKYRQVKRAVEAKDRELREIYDIQKAATSLVALIETQTNVRQTFEVEMANRKEELSSDSETMRSEWAQEKERHTAEIKDRDLAEKKQREREKEAFEYEFEREKQLARDKFQDEQARQERDFKAKKEAMEHDLTERDTALAAKEAEWADLNRKAGAFPGELATAVEKSVKEAVDRVQVEARNREALLKKEFEGERNVLQTRIESLESIIKEQQERLERLAQQSEKAYGQVQDIAIKAVEGASHLQVITRQQPASESSRRPSDEK